MLSVIGDETEDTIELPNGMVIKIDYGDKNINDFGITGRYSGRNRRVRLFDNKKNLITELIEDNPHKEPVPKENFKNMPENIIS